MSDANRRRSGRLVCAGLVSDLGAVPDVSAGGCRVVCKHWRPLTLGADLTLTLDGDGLTVEVAGRIVRRVRRGLRRFEYGIEFVGVTPEQAEVIRDISRITSVKRMMPTVEEVISEAA